MFTCRLNFKKILLPKKICTPKYLSSDQYTELYKRNYIGNKFCLPKANAFYINNSPFDGSLIGEFSASSTNDTLDAITAAFDSFPAWSSGNNTFERAKLLELLANNLNKQKEKLAQIMTTEMGKPIKESVKEIEASVGILKWYSEESKRINGEIILSGPESKNQLVLRKPHGVVGLISPWNFPLMMIVRSLSAALAAGCTLVVKPAPETPLTGLMFAKLIQECNFPSGVVNVITGSASSSPQIGYTLCHDARVSHISFTGSTAAGKLLMRDAASSVKRCSMELGGNAPFIVFESADINQAVKCLRLAKYTNTGQTCISPNRIFVQSSIYDQFCASLENMVKKLKIASPFEADCQISCLYHQKGYNKVKSIVEKALASGAKQIYQSEFLKDMGSAYFPPTIISNCDHSMSFSHEEIFGPAVCLYRFNDEAEVVNLANSTSHGLAAYAYTRDINQTLRIMHSLNFGMVAINDVALTTLHLPFGGVKESGIGSEMGRYGIYNYMDIKSIVVSSVV